MHNHSNIIKLHEEDKHCIRFYCEKCKFSCRPFFNLETLFKFYTPGHIEKYLNKERIFFMKNDALHYYFKYKTIKDACKYSDDEWDIKQIIK